MLALSEGAQISLIGAIVTATLAPTWLAWWNSRLARKQLTTNGGDSALDKINSINGKLDSVKVAAARATELAAFNAEKIDRIREGQEERAIALEELTVKVDEHIRYMNEVHDRSGKPERRTT